MLKKSIIATSIVTSLFMSAALPVYANPTEFGSCVNPQWSKTQENHGANHGVIGVGTFSGVDSIYESNGNVMQCLCADNGAGYQTNWVKAQSHEQVESMKAQGWMYVPEGQDWGLAKGPYMAKNEAYTCVNCTPTPTTTVTPTVTTVPGPTTENKVGGASANNSSSPLASTGNALIIYISLLAGAVALILGMVLKKFSN